MRPNREFDVSRTNARRVAALAGLLVGTAAAVPCSPAVRGADGAHAAAAVPAPAATKTPVPPTYHDARLWRLAFDRRTLSGAYRAVGKHDPAWDDKAVAFLDRMAEQFGQRAVPEFYRPSEAYPRQQALSDAAALAALGCDDPLVLYCNGTLLMEAGRWGDALPLMQKAGSGMRRAGYPPIRLAGASVRLARSAKDKAEVTALTARARADFVDACRGPLAAEGRQALLDAVWDWLDDRAAQQAFVTALAAKPDADPWILGVASGRLHVALAWDSRGDGSANTVTEAGWRGFHANLKLGRDDLVGAWKADPTLPEAPAEMITVSMGAGSELGEREDDWFGRAVAAQADYEPAYQKMLGGPLLPRWGGSHEAMIRLGEACLVDPRYDTLVPWQYLSAIRSVGIDAGQPWELLKDPTVYDRVVAVCEGYLKAPAAGRQDAFVRTGRAAAAWRAGRWAEARKALDALAAGGRKPVLAAFGWFGADDPAIRLAEVYARTGPRAADAAAAEDLAAADKPADAAAKLRALAAGAAADDPAAADFTGRAARLDADAKFAAGDWAPLSTGASLAGWREDQGTWRADPDGTLSTPQGKPGWSRLMWTDPASARLGTAFEVSGTIRFQPGAKLNSPKYSGGVFLFDRDRPSATLYVGLWVAQDAISYNSEGGGETKYRRTLTDSPAFRLRVVGHDLTLWVDGQQVGDPYRIPDRGGRNSGSASAGAGHRSSRSRT